MGIINKFLRNKDGNYAATFAFAMLPIFGAVGISVDYSNMSRLNYNVSNAVDSMCTITASQFMDGRTDDAAKLAGTKFFKANIEPDFVDTAIATFVMPNASGNIERTLRCRGELTYKPIFGPVVAHLMGADKTGRVTVSKEARMRMRNVAEIALVLDNSGSMAWDKNGNSGASSANQRITLLKNASKNLVTKMITVGAKIQNATDPVRFSIVPFAGAVNVGANNANESWMDTRGISPIHHEHLNWGVPGPDNPTGFRSVATTDGAKLDVNGNPLTRFSILNALQFRSGGTAQTSQCAVWRTSPSNGSSSNCRIFHRTGTTNVAVNSTLASSGTGLSLADLNAKYRWTGCVEARPNGLDLTDDVASGTTAFVPFFVPDELNLSTYDTTTSVTAGENNWWPDYEDNTDLQTQGYWPNTVTFPVTSHNASNTTWQSGKARPREVDVRKYFVNKPFLSGTASNSTNTRTKQSAYFTGEAGPNDGCRTTPITPLVASESALHTAIEAMKAGGSTNIPEGLAWGWRTLTQRAPFTQGSAPNRQDIDRVVILLTDGANTYGTYSAGDNGDMAGNKTYNYAFGRTGYAGNAGPNGTASPSSATNPARIFHGTTASPTSLNSSNYQEAMDQKMKTICKNITNEKFILMTVALDMDPLNYSVSERPAIQKAIDTMTTCASDSRTRKKLDGSPVKLFWDAKSDTLDETFDEIADELSNLRFTQ